MQLRVTPVITATHHLGKDARGRRVGVEAEGALPCGEGGGGDEALQLVRLFVAHHKA